MGARLRIAPAGDDQRRRLRVVIAEDHALMRDGLMLVLERGGFDVVGVAEDGGGLLRKTDALNPDIVVTDVRMPPTQTDEGLRAALAIRRSRPDISIVVLTHHVQRGCARELFESARSAGGIGYLLKQRVADTGAFCADLRRIGAGAAVLDPEVVAMLLRRPRRDDALERLTPRQRTVLELMVEGASNAAIARRLVLTEKAVVKHVSHIYVTLGLQPDADEHRRVRAVTRFLDGAPRTLAS